MNKPMHFFAKFDDRWQRGAAGRIVYAFKADDLSDWCVHGTDFSKPFAQCSMRSKKWCVSHIGTLRRIPKKYTGDLTFKEAFSLALKLDALPDLGMSQVRDEDETIATDQAVLGLSKQMSETIKAAIIEWKSNDKQQARAA